MRTGTRELPPRENSTNGRATHDSPLLTGTLRLLGRTVPSLASEAASRLFLLVPRVSPPRGEAAAFLESGTRFHVSGGGERLAAWRWGRGPAILLVHGWAGRGTQLRAFVPALVRAGFEAVVFDGPAHGASGGFSTSLPAFADAITAVARATGARGAVAHSMGGAATLLAVARGLTLSRAVVLGAPSDSVEIWDGFRGALGLDDAVAAEARRRVERRVGVGLEELRLSRLADRIRMPVLVVHDRDDAEVPWHAGEANARLLSEGSLFETRGLGHRGALRDRDVIGRSVRYLSEGIRPARCESCGLAVGTDGSLSLCAACLVDRELFDPGERLTA